MTNSIPAALAARMKALGRLHRSRRLVAALRTMVGAATFLGIIGAATPAFAVPQGRVTGSWNMLGQMDTGGERPDSRWHTGVQQMLNTDGVQVAALQEAGNTPPPSANATDRHFPTYVTEFQWDIGTNSRPDIVNIYWTNTGSQGNGLAIVSRDTARNAVQLAVHGRWDSRTMMGVQFGNDWYFTAHAGAHGEFNANEAEDIIETARQFMARRPPGEDWLVIADFNRNPASMPPRLQRHIVAPNAPTHERGGQLDFAYGNTVNNNNVVATRRGIGSDHFYVRYTANPDCAESGGPSARAVATKPCNAPLPGARYRFFARHLNNAVIAAGDALRPFVKEPTGSEDETIEVRFSSVPGQYLLAFNNGNCLSRDSGGRDEVTEVPCRPDVPEQSVARWQFHEGQIFSPGLGASLQPRLNVVGANLVVATSIYQWRAELATTNVTIEVDPHIPVDVAALHQAVELFAKYNLSGAVDRIDNSTWVDIPGFKVHPHGPDDGPEGGAVSITASGTGLSADLSIPASVVSNPQDPYWTDYMGYLLSALSMQLFRASCEQDLYRFPWYTVPHTGTGVKITKVICADITTTLTPEVVYAIIQHLNGRSVDASQMLQAAIRGLGQVIPVALWNSDMMRFVGRRLLRLTGPEGVLLAWKLPNFPSAVGHALVSASDDLQTVTQRLYQSADTIASAPPTIGASSPPCDIYTYYATPCVGAYSTTRALYSRYQGPLYQVHRATDGTTRDIYPVEAGGVANSSAQDAFCSGTTCRISMLYDQSPNWNDLTVAPGGGAAQRPDRPVYAASLPVKVGGDPGNPVYGMAFSGAMGYRNNAAVNTATGSEAEGMYMVASGTHVNNGCCFDFGNAEVNSMDNGAGRMDAVNLSTTCFFQDSQGPCTGNGPWVQADLEDGLFQGGNGTNSANTGNSSNFVTAMLKNNGTDTYAIKGGNGQSGGVSTYWNGSLPTILGPGNRPYAPMQKEGAIILGIGGDNSNSDIGSFFEGAMTIGYPSDAADNLIQQNIVRYAGYTGNSAGISEPQSATAGPAVVHDGYSSVFTVNSANGHLEESYLPAMNSRWFTQDLSATAVPGPPPVMNGTKPVALFHGGYTSVYTVDASNGHLWETYLTAIGQKWTAQDLTAKYKTPATNVTPTAVLHDGYTSVYTIDASNGHLWEAYLRAIGAEWHPLDLTEIGKARPVAPGTAPVSVVHDGFTSVYTVDASKHLQETFLAQLGGEWKTQDLSAQSRLPDTTVTPTVVVHDGFTSVYTVNDVDHSLWETFLPKIGDEWSSQELPGAPGVEPGTSPVALFHGGYTSVYTAAWGTDHLWETFLPKIGDKWHSQDLTAIYKTPATSETPAVLLHPDTNGAVTWTSVFTTDQFNGHLWETYLPKIGDRWTRQDLSAKYKIPSVAATQSPTAGPALAHDGYSSVFTVNSVNGHLQESYLSAIGERWATHDLSVIAKTPVVKAGTRPVALYHQGFTSVFTVDATNGHLWETYLSAIGQDWVSHDLSAKALGGTPATQVTPTAVFHGGWTSVYTVDAGSGDLRETYLPQLGGDWFTQNLSVKYRSPQVQAGTSPAAIVHSGWTSVYTVDPAHHVWESYLPAIGYKWSAQDLTKEAGTPATTVTPAVAFHSGWTSVYTVDDVTHHLDETYLPAIGDKWVTQDLTQLSKGPGVAPGTQPVALYHTSVISVYTVAWGNNHLHETYLPTIGANWTPQDLTATYRTPSTTKTPMALLHADTTGALTWTSVYTVNQTGQGTQQDLHETYLPAIGQKWATQDLSAAPPHVPKVDVNEAPTAGPALAHDGYTSIYTVNARDNHLEESYLSAMGQDWATLDLLSGFSTYFVRSGSMPTALTHDGFTSVFWVKGGTFGFPAGDLMETYLPTIGGKWTTQDLTRDYHAPRVREGSSPAAVYHDGYTSVFTVDENGHLNETYQAAVGEPWANHDLSAAPINALRVADGTNPAVVYHSGWTSVFTIDIDNNLRETYLPAIGDQWVSQDLHRRAASVSPAPVVHDGYVSVFTENFYNGSIWESYLTAIGNEWVSRPLSPSTGVAPGTQPVALYHNGYTSVFFSMNFPSGGRSLMEFYLPAIGQEWTLLNLSDDFHTPYTQLGPAAVLHYDTSGNLTWPSVFTVDGSTSRIGDLDETYLPAIGQRWAWQDLGLKFDIPKVGNL